MSQIPILFLSDSVDQKTGLARITRDLCGQLCRNPKFRVGSLGLGGNPSRSLPWPQYVIDEKKGPWGSGDLPRVWSDFAGQQRGIVMTIWDLTRLHWLSRPQYSGDRELTKWLQESHFDLWGYLPIDALGPGGRLSSIAADALQGFSRLLTYTRWAKVAVNATLGDLASEARNLDWMPHGIDFNAWGLMDKDEAKKGFYPFLHHGEHLVGAIGTNQARKDWGLVAQTCRLIAEQRKDVKFWWHSDLPERHWSFNSLLYDFGLQSRVKITYQMTGQELNTAYNACDLTLHPGLGEGFGYPIFESLACGTPILHGDYGGGADLLFTSGYSGSMVRPESFRVEGVHNQVRPVFSPKDWADMALDVLGEDSDRERLRASISHLAWANLWPLFEQWFEKGVRNG